MDSTHKLFTNLGATKNKQYLEYDDNYFIF